MEARLGPLLLVAYGAGDEAGCWWSVQHVNGDEIDKGTGEPTLGRAQEAAERAARAFLRRH
jgi:hypothetical protein